MVRSFHLKDVSFENESVSLSFRKNPHLFLRALFVVKFSIEEWVYTSTFVCSEKTSTRVLEGIIRWASKTFECPFYKRRASSSQLVSKLWSSWLCPITTQIGSKLGTENKAYFRMFDNEKHPAGINFGLDWPNWQVGLIYECASGLSLAEPGSGQGPDLGLVLFLIRLKTRGHIWDKGVPTTTYIMMRVTKSVKTCGAFSLATNILQHWDMCEAPFFPEKLTFLLEKANRRGSIWSQEAGSQDILIHRESCPFFCKRQWIALKLLKNLWSGFVRAHKGDQKVCRAGSELHSTSLPHDLSQFCLRHAENSFVW